MVPPKKLLTYELRDACTPSKGTQDLRPREKYPDHGHAICAGKSLGDRRGRHVFRNIVRMGLLHHTKSNAGLLYPPSANHIRQKPGLHAA